MPFTCTVPAVPTVLTVNKRARITRWDFAPGATTGWHEHALDYVIVMMTDATMAYEMNGVITRNELKAGDSYIRPASIQHDVKNDRSLPMAFIEVEMRR